MPDECFVHLDKLFVFTFPEEDLVSEKGLSESRADHVNMFLCSLTLMLIKYLISNQQWYVSKINVLIATEVIMSLYS